jgi:hypothetical protein
VSYLACKQNATTPSAEHTLKVTATSTTIKDLVPYSKYSLSVFAENTKLKGLPAEFLEETLPADEIESEEISEMTVTPDMRWVNIKLSRNCDKIRGQLVMKMTVICTNKWCKNQNRTKTTTVSDQNQIITLDGLTSFSKYSLDLTFCRDSMNCKGDTKRQTFRTKPTIPNTVNDLLIYTKNESSVSLRWKPPYPPTGVLQKYKIEYQQEYLIRSRDKNGFEMTSCTLWPDFHCITVCDLERGVEYTFKVNAKNEDVREFGPAISISTKTEIEPPGAPYDLNITWTINNDLILQWKHPKESNGPIKYFNITLNSERDKVKKTLPIKNDIYYLNYNFKVDSAEVYPSTLYTFRVSAFNSFSGHYLSLRDTSPPDIPLLNGDPQSDSTNDTITLKISFQKLRGKTDNRLLYIFILDKNNTFDSYKFEKFGLKNLKIAVNCTLEPSQESLNVTIGNAYQFDNCYQTNNLPLEPATFYNVTILLLDTFQNKSSYNKYSLMYKTLDVFTYKTLDRPVHIQKNLYGLFLLLLLIPVIGYLYV